MKHGELSAFLIGEADVARIDLQGRGSYDNDPAAWRSGSACYSCGRRGHSHQDCPGITVEEPVIRRLVWTYPAERLDRED